MPCAVKYLCSAGIHRREVVGVQALAQSYPSNWLLYCSLNAFPKNSPPIEIDALVVMDDRIVLLELKDWNGILKHDGDSWYLNNRRHGRSPVVLGNEKAKKIKGIIKESIPQLSYVYVDSRVVLTGTATKDLLPEDQKPSVLSLDEAKALGDLATRNKLLGKVRLTTTKPNMFVKEFDRLFHNERYFEPLKRNWDGYTVTDEDFYLHRDGVWGEHLAHLAKEERFKALLRLWRFDHLPPGLNEPSTRTLIANREIGVAAFLGERRSWVAENSLLRPTGIMPDEVLTQHFQLFTVPNGWTTLRRYLERMKNDLTSDQRIDIIHTLASIVAEMHSQGVSHRDLGLDCIWSGSPSAIALTGLACATLPDETSVSDWLSALGTYSDFEVVHATEPTAMQRDVRAIGLIMKEVGRDTQLSSDVIGVWDQIIETATASPAQRYSHALALADAVGELRNPPGPDIDQTRLDSFQTSDIPFIVWPPLSPPETNGRSHRYISVKGEARYLVKVWNVQRGVAELDHALLRMFENASALIAVPIQGIPPVIKCGLSPFGPFVITEYIEGTPLSEKTDLDTTEVLTVLSNLVEIVSRLHSRGMAHGDLHPQQIIVSDEQVICIVDLLDLPATGGRGPRSTRYAPPDFERRSPEEIDRYATCRMALDLCNVDDDRFSILRDRLEEELSRQSIQTLESVQQALNEVYRNLTKTPAPHFQIHLPGLALGPIDSDGGFLRVRWYQGADSIDIIFVQGIKIGILLRVVQETVKSHEVYQVEFNQLTLGTPIEMNLVSTSRPSDGFGRVAQFIRATIAPESETPPIVPDETDTTEDRDLRDFDAEEEKENAVRRGSDLDAPFHLNISNLWLRASILEEEAVQTVTLGRRLADAGDALVYRYSSSTPLEFEDEDTVEIRMGRGLQGRKVGLLDLRRSDLHQIGIRDPRGHFSEGDLLSLVDRRDRVSKDRRSRAVTRITSRQSVIPNLIDFFDPSKRISGRTYALPTVMEIPSGYGLNDGQKKAFQQLLGEGPVGLLQGPPGPEKHAL